MSDEFTTDGCSSPLGRWLQETWPQALPCCHAHDRRYGRGGTERDRLIADLLFFL